MFACDCGMGKIMYYYMLNLYRVTITINLRSKILGFYSSNFFRILIREHILCKNASKRLYHIYLVKISQNGKKIKISLKIIYINHTAT